MMTIQTIAAHIEMMRQAGQHEYAESARIWYWDLLGPYLKANHDPDDHPPEGMPPVWP
jgi:hypothetical protein